MSSLPRFDSLADAHAWANRPKKPEVRTRLVPTEDEEQIALLDWTRLQWRAMPELADLYHCPNGGFRKKREAVRFSRMGVHPGIPDLILPHARHGAHSLYLEMKALDGHPSELQIERAVALVQAGNMVAFAWGWEMGRDILLWYVSTQKVIL